MAEELPVAAIVCIVLACWAVLILAIVGLCQFLKSRGVCKGNECAPCGKEGDPRCSECCISLSESCNCCKPNLDGCLNSVCGQRKHVTCADIILCQCCAAPGEDPCCTKCCKCQYGCDYSSTCCDRKHNCSCCNTECEAFTCCCLEIRLKNPRLTSRNYDSSQAGHSRNTTESSEANMSILTARSVKSVSHIELLVKSTNSSLSSIHKSKTSSPILKTSSARSLPKPSVLPQRTARTQPNVSSKATKNAMNKSVSKSSAQKKKVTETDEENSLPVLKKSNANNFNDASLHLNLSSGAIFNDELNNGRPPQRSRPLPVPQLSTECADKSSFRKLPRLPD